jgi:hypothetical protein
MRGIASHDGIRIGEPGSEISRLVGLGFLESGRARTTMTPLPSSLLPVFKALVLRFAR